MRSSDTVEAGTIGGAACTGISLGVALPTVSDEHKALLNVTTRGTDEGVMLEARGCHGVVWDDPHQGHCGPAGHAAHQINSPPQ